MKQPKIIRDLAGLCDHFGAGEPRELPRRLYKDTECGASISLYFEGAPPLHCGDRARWDALTRATPIRGFTIQTIVEGSDATVDSDEFKLPVAAKVVDDWIEKMEAEASFAWDEANDRTEDDQ